MNRSELMSRIRSSGTKPELLVRAAASRLGLSYTANFRALPGRPDLVLVREGGCVAVFVHGCFWHGCPRHYREPKTNKAFWRAKIGRNKKRHAQVLRQLRKRGTHAVTVWGHELRAVGAEHALVRALARKGLTFPHTRAFRPNQGETMKKTYLKRDGAVAALRKAGVKPEDYEKNLAKVEGGFEATLPDAPEKAPDAGKAKVAEALKGLKRSVDKQAKKAAKPAKKEKAPKAERVSIGSVVRGLVKAGKSNEEIWPVIKKQFKLGDDKKWYPAWYRSDMARRKKAGK